MDVLKPFVNGSAHHTDHHLFFNCNYGQFFTLWDRIGGSFKEPTAFSSEDPKSIMKKGELDKKDKNQWNKSIYVYCLYKWKFFKNLIGVYASK